MKLSVITPVLNQVEFIEQTIQSVLSQKCENLEYIILDGGSTDGTVDIIQKYESELKYWHSKPDNGQSAAIKEGFEMATGDIICWINADDYYMPDVFSKVVKKFKTNTKLKLLYGDYAVIDENSRIEAKSKISYDFDMCLFSYLMIPQPSSFWLKSLYDDLGGLNTKYNFAFDWDFYLRVGEKLAGEPEAIEHVQDLYSIFRLHPESKSVSQQQKFKEERKSILAQFDRYNNCLFKSLMPKYQLLKVLNRFRKERNFMPFGKDKRKA